MINVLFCFTKPFLPCPHVVTFVLQYKFEGTLHPEHHVQERHRRLEWGVPSPPHRSLKAIGGPEGSLGCLAPGGSCQLGTLGHPVAEVPWWRQIDKAGRAPTPENSLRGYLVSRHGRPQSPRQLTEHPACTTSTGATLHGELGTHFCSNETEDN